MSDKLLNEIADYVIHFQEFTQEALYTAHLALFDSLGCAMQALKFPACLERLGPFFPGMKVEKGCRVPGTHYILDPIQGTFNLGTLIRWLDYNDTWLGQEWGHPSDNFGALLMVGDYLDRPLTVQKILEAAIQAYEIQGILALNHAFNRAGFDHVILVKVASAALSAKLWGGTHDAILAAVSNAFADGGPLRVYRHAPDTGPRKSWAAGDSAARGVFLAERALRGEMPYNNVLSTPRWGVSDVFFNGKPMELVQPLGNYVMENILFKISFPAEFHAQTAVEAALTLHPEIKNKIAQIKTITIETHASALCIIDKKGPLTNPADRDHCLQYMVAVALLHGSLTAEHYEDKAAKHPELDSLRNKMIVREHAPYSLDYHDPNKRSIASSLQITFKDGTSTIKVAVEYPLGHKRRRSESLPFLEQKLTASLANSPLDPVPLLHLFHNPQILAQMPLKNFISLWIPCTNKRAVNF